MISNYKIVREGNEDILYIYLDSSTEFGLDFFKKENLSKINKDIKEYIKEKGLTLKATAVVLMLNGMIVGKLPMNEVYGTTDQRTSIVSTSSISYQSGLTHTVQKGDTLYSLSRKYNISVDQIKSLNGLANNTLSIGQKLIVTEYSVISYTIQKSDTLYSIAKKYNTTVSEIKSLNNLTSDTLSIGQTIYIKADVQEEIQTQIEYTVQQGDTLYSLARKFNTTVDKIKSVNNLNSDVLSIGQILFIPSGNIETEKEDITSNYTVQKGDTLYSLAKRFDTTVDKIKSLNGLTSNTLSIGQVLKIPGTTSSESNKIYINLHRSNGKIEKIELEQYVINVVAAEMPALFETEALKAQAIASRTYTMKKVGEGKVLTDTTQTQSYKDVAQLKQQWGNNFDKYYNKIKEAVHSTEGEVVKYKGEYIDAIYHSTSNSRTEDPKYVWGGSLDYLKSVDSSWDKNATGYEQTTTKDFATLSRLLGVTINKNTSIKVVSRTQNGSINILKIGTKEFKGTEIRKLVGLRSTDFDIDIINNSIRFTTRGYGHQVGMSQYGANGMAKEGYKYRQIINHYYTNVSIEGINNK